MSILSDDFDDEFIPLCRFLQGQFDLAQKATTDKLIVAETDQRGEKSDSFMQTKGRIVCARGRPAIFSDFFKAYLARRSQSR
jgi:hypothetical protein